MVDGATDQTETFLRGLQFPCESQILQQANRGQAAARNSGIKAALGKYVLLLDDDLECVPALLEQHLAAHTAEKLVVMGPIRRHENFRSIPAEAVDREISAFYDSLPGGPTESSWLPPNSSVEREALLALGGYDESFVKAREDTDLGLRLSNAGLRFQFAPNAVVFQMHAKTASELVRDSARFGAMDVRLIRKHPAHLALSNLSGIQCGSSMKRWLRRLAAVSPLSPGPLLAPLYAATIAISGTGVGRRAGSRLLDLRRYIAWIRAASRAAGGWNALLAEIERARNSSAASTGERA